MKKTKLLIAFALSATALVSACAPATNETMTDEEICKAVISSAAVLTNSVKAPIRDESYGLKNNIEQKAAHYIIAQTNYSYLTDSGNTFDVVVDWDFDSTLFTSETVEANGSSYLQLNPVWGEFGTVKSTTITGTAKLNNATASLKFNVDINSNKNIVPIKDMPGKGVTCAVQGYVTSFIPDTDPDNWYGILVQAGNYGFMIYDIPKKNVPNGLKVGDCIEVSGESSPYNSTRQITGSKAVITILSGKDVEGVEKPTVSELNHPGFMSPATYASLSTISGAKVLEVNLYDNSYNGKVTEDDFLEAKVLYKGSEVYVYADRYNHDQQGKLDLYDMFKEALDSNGEKTINFTGMQSQRKTYNLDPGTGNTDMIAVSGESALMFVSTEGCEVVNEPYVEAKAATITYTGNLFVGSTLPLKATVEGEENPVFTWSSSDTSVATVDQNGVVTGISEGAVTISVTTESGAIGVVTLDCSERQGEPAYVKASVSEILEAQNNTTQAYVVRGKVKALGQYGDDSDVTKYGNLILEDENDPSKEILVYGITAEYDALTFDAATGEYVFENPKNALDNPLTKGIKVGDIVTMVAIRADYKETKEIQGVLTSLNDERSTATKATLADVIKGPVDGMTSQYVYEVTAEISRFKGEEPDQYGNLYLKDESIDGEVFAYGATASTAISFNYNDSWKYSMGNPKDFLTNEVTKDLKPGDKITFECVRSDYNGTVQLVIDNVRKA